MPPTGPYKVVAGTRPDITMGSVVRSSPWVNTNTHPLFVRASHPGSASCDPPLPINPRPESVPHGGYISVKAAAAAAARRAMKGDPIGQQ